MITTRRLRFVIFEVAIRQIVIRLGTRGGVRRESLVDILYLPFRKLAREHFEALLLDVQCHKGICHSRVEK